MRIWSLHPKFLDQKGLVACWRETLLAQKVLMGQTRGYKNHSQLKRFKKMKDPVAAIGLYLTGLYEEACRRGYSFDKSKIHKVGNTKLWVTDGQMKYEWHHLRKKLMEREPKRLIAMKKKDMCSHDMFKVVPGKIESWEVV